VRNIVVRAEVSVEQYARLVALKDRYDGTNMSGATARGQYRLADQAIAVYRRWAQEERMALPQELAAQHRTAARP
jgi:hypothetical protein